jgi:hypothetical protein
MMLARMGEEASLEVKLRFQEALRQAVDAYGRAVVLRERIHKWQNMEIAPAPNESLPVEDEVMIQPGYRLSKTEMGI